MKKLLLSLVLLVPFVTGCADIDTQITINNDKTASVVTSLTYQGSLSDMRDEYAQSIYRNYENFIDPMYSVENVYSANLSTITASKKVSDITKEDLDLSSLGFVSNLPSQKFVEVKKNFLITSYNINVLYNYEEQKHRFEELKGQNINSSTSATLQPEYYHKYVEEDNLGQNNDEFNMAANLDDAAKQLVEEDIAAPSVNLKKAKIDNVINQSFSIKLPTFASYNNADNSKGFIYTWNIRKDAPTEIKLQYVQYSGWAITFIILLGVLLLVYIAKRIIRRDTQKRLDNIENIV